MSAYAQILGQRVADGHPHLEDFRECGVLSQEDVVEYVESIANSEETLCFTFVSTGDQKSYREADVYYHQPTNTAIIEPRNPVHEATMFKPGYGKIWFDEKVKESERLEKRDIELCRGIEELERNKARTLEQKREGEEAERNPVEAEHEKDDLYAKLLEQWRENENTQDLGSGRSR